MTDFNSLAYLQKSLEIADDIKTRFGAEAASYFEIIVQCYLPLMLQNSASENRTFPQTTLEKMLSLKAYAPLPDEYFQPLIAAARQARTVEDLKQTVFDFDRKVYEFLCARLVAPPAAEPMLTVTTAGINYVNTPAAPAAVAAAPAEASSQKTNRAIYFAWSLGSSLASDSIAMTHINAAQTEPHFERAQMSAMGLGITVNRLTGMTHDQISNDAKASLHLLADEGRRIAEQIDSRHGGTISSYFKMIVRCHLLLLFYNDRLEHRKDNQSHLDNVLSLKPDTLIPDAFFQPLISAVRENVAWFVFKPIVYEFDRAVGEFLHQRIDGAKNTIEKNVVEENHQTPAFKSIAQTTRTAAQTTPNPPVTLSEPLQTLAAYSQGRADNNKVLRSLVSHRGWFAPLELFYTEGENKRRVEKVVIISAENQLQADSMCLFTDYESVLRASETNAPIGAYGGEMSGTELFGKIPAGINKIRVNSYSPVERTWSFMDETSVELARLWSEVIALEEKFKYFQPGKPDLAALGNYRGFITVVNAETGGIFLIKEFNEEMRIAAPVFTAPDSADRFLASLPPEKSAALKQITINGDTLLNDLPNMKIEMPNEEPSRSFDGAVINAYGPGVFYILRFDDIRK